MLGRVLTGDVGRGPSRVGEESAGKQGQPSQLRTGAVARWRRAAWPRVTEAVPSEPRPAPQV